MHTHIYIHACTYVSTHTHIHAHIILYTHIHTHIYTHIHTHIHTCTNTHANICTYTNYYNSNADGLTFTNLVQKTVHISYSLKQKHNGMHIYN